MRIRQKQVRDEDLQEGIKLYLEIKRSIEMLLVIREATLKNLYRFKKEIETSYDKVRISNAYATSAIVSGAVFSSLGLALSPITFGASLGLLVAGGIIAAGGGMAISIAQIEYYIVSKEILDNANQACANDRELMGQLSEYSKRYIELLHTLAKKYHTTEWEVKKRIMEKEKVTTFTLVDGKSDIARLRIYGEIVSARACWADLKTSRPGIEIVEIVYIPDDLATWINSVHKYSSNGKSNSKGTQEVQSLINKLEKHRDKLHILLSDCN